MTAPGAEQLVALLAELDRVRALAVGLLEDSTPQLNPEPPATPSSRERAVFDLLVGARRAVLGNPGAARAVCDLLVAEGRRHAATPEGAELCDALVASEAVENLRRVWETVTLNVLDGPASGVTPDAWAELLADAVVGQGLDPSVLDRLRPEGFA